VEAKAGAEFWAAGAAVAQTRTPSIPDTKNNFGEVISNLIGFSLYGAKGRRNLTIFCAMARGILVVPISRLAVCKDAIQENGDPGIITGEI
jgi:hypothetical protein